MKATWIQFIYAYNYQLYHSTVKLIIRIIKNLIIFKLPPTIVVIYYKKYWNTKKIS